MRRGLLTAVAAVLVLTGCSSTTSMLKDLRTTRLERYPAPPKEQSLQIGDRITIYLYAPPENQTLSEVIDGREEVKLPYIGPVRIGGMTAAQAEETIENTYVEKGIYKRDSIHVNVVPPVSEFFVEGCVFHPGKYEFTRTVTVLQAISGAGGADDFADLRRVTVKRRGVGIIPVDAKAAAENRDLDIFIEPGDIVKVPPRWL
jgi:polysaccharide export outer membrane protein